MADLQRYEALTWLADLNGDGKSEIIVWDSFSLGDHVELSDYALVAWVYGVTGDSSMLDWDRAAETLEQLAHGRCKSKK